MQTIPLRMSEKCAWGAFGLVGFIGLWAALSAFGIVPRQFLPSPLDVLTRFVHLLTNPFAGATLPQHLASSFQRYAYGVLLAAFIGVPLG
ncbi:MAG: ABC transporter permease, partial [Hyphomicrobiales bacterium]